MKTEKEEEKKEEEKEKAEEKKEEKEKVNMLTKLSNAFSKLKPQPSAAASAAPEAKAEETPSDKPEAEAEEKKEVGPASVHVFIPGLPPSLVSCPLGQFDQSKAIPNIMCCFKLCSFCTLSRMMEKKKLRKRLKTIPEVGFYLTV